VLMVQPDAMSALLKRKAPVPKRVLSEAEMQLFTVTANTGEIVMVGAQGVLLDQGQQAVRVGTSDITLTTAGSERLRVNSSGNVGIGTDNPKFPLQIRGSGVNAYNPPPKGTSAGSSLFIEGANPGYGMAFAVSDYGISYIQAQRHDSANNDTFPLCLNPNGGNVGIGTNSPLCRLHVNSGTGDIVGTFLSQSMTTGQNNSILIGKSWQNRNCATILYNHIGEGSTSNYLGLGVYANDNILNIRADGRVGIGTNSPGGTLHVGGSLITDWNIYCRGSDFLITNADRGSGGRALVHDNGNRLVMNYGGDFNGGITLVGNVGVGVNEPYRPLMVNGTGQIWATPTRYFDIGTGNLAYNADSIGNIAIAALGSIVAGGAIAAYSDERIKANIRPISYSISDLLALQPVEYTHIDTIKNSGKNQLGFIAQQVKNVCPEVVDDTEISYIPDVYRVEKVIQQSGKSILVSLSKEVSWKAGDKVQIISREKPIEGCSVLEISPSQCLIELPTEESISPEVFLYGKKVEDFHTIDYGKITALLVKCAQDQYHIMSSLSDRLSRLEALLSR